MKIINRAQLWPVLRDLLFPESCLACNAGLKGQRPVSFCRTCQDDVRLLREPFCTICGKPFEDSAGGNHRCAYCLKNSWFFTCARAIVYYQGPIVEALKMFKYHGKMCGLETFETLKDLYYQFHPYPEADIILPVPLYPKRLRKRGFNQALVLGRKLFKKEKRIIDPHILERHQWRAPQTGLSGKERRKNVKNAFRVKSAEKIYNKKILLLDDVFTTGATANECARILLKNGASEVEVFTFARVVGR